MFDGLLNPFTQNTTDSATSEMVHQFSNTLSNSEDQFLFFNEPEMNMNFKVRSSAFCSVSANPQKSLQRTQEQDFVQYSKKLIRGQARYCGSANTFSQLLFPITVASIS